MARLDLYVNYELQASIKLKEQEVAVGRDPSCAIQIPDPKVSRRHAVVSVSAAGHVIENLGANGTRVNGNKISAVCPLNPGDAIFIASNVLVYQLDDAPVSELDPTVMDD